eukprot:TRINITY_DN808_c0_g1_i1.p1 TRINITY_DN808_c0_g1~~TRINITY_DN808_c0_g1_i1.p1  ORF type:complete len:208 (+),score=51.80 TRINITY_DN808_c0_g1_i1:26-625(+)
MEDDEQPTNVPKLAPKKVLYCGVCGLPPEYCEFGPNFEKCKPWLMKNCPGLYPNLEEEEKLKAEGGEDKAEGEKEGKSSKRGGKGLVKPDKEGDVQLPGGKVKKQEKPMVRLSRVQRNKKKHITVVMGLEKFGIKLTDASKVFAKRFSCGSAVIKMDAGGEEIDVQGDVLDDMIDFLEEKWQISDDSVIIDDKPKKGPK